VRELEPFDLGSGGVTFDEVAASSIKQRMKAKSNRLLATIVGIIVLLLIVYRILPTITVWLGELRHRSSKEAWLESQPWWVRCLYVLLLFLLIRLLCGLVVNFGDIIRFIKSTLLEAAQQSKRKKERARWRKEQARLDEDKALQRAAQEARWNLEFLARLETREGLLSYIGEGCEPNDLSRALNNLERLNLTNEVEFIEPLLRVYRAAVQSCQHMDNRDAFKTETEHREQQQWLLAGKRVRRYLEDSAASYDARVELRSIRDKWERKYREINTADQDSAADWSMQHGYRETLAFMDRLV